jgi:hypothetical protein
MKGKGAGIGTTLNMEHGLFALISEQNNAYIIHIQMFIYRRPV